MKLAISSQELKRLEKLDPPIQKVWPTDSLRILAFSDYRVQDIQMLVDFARNLRPAANLLLYAGDDVERFQDGRNFFEELAATTSHGLCAVVGNDAPAQHRDARGRVRIFQEVVAARSYIKGANVHNVHRTPVVMGNYGVLGNEGSPPDEKWGALGTIIYPEQSIARHLRSAAKDVKGKHLIVVSHTPPRGVLDFAIRFGKRHIGTVALRRFLDKRRNVPLVVCGHVHYCGGQAKRFGRSTVVNAASHDDPGAPGKVAVIELQDGKVVRVEWHVLWELSSIPGIGDKRASFLQSSGIRSLHELTSASAEEIAKTVKTSLAEASTVARQGVLFDLAGDCADG